MFLAANARLKGKGKQFLSIEQSVNGWTLFRCRGGEKFPSLAGQAVKKCMAQLGSTPLGCHGNGIFTIRLGRRNALAARLAMGITVCFH